MKLCKIDKSNVWKIVRLSVSDDQSGFVATNTESILEAYITITSGKVALPFGIFNDDGLPVGFVMFGYGRNDEDDPEVAVGNYCLWRFMIDKEYQHLGFGRKSLLLALDYLRSFPAGHADYCWLSYEPANKAAKALYNSVGFAESGEMCGDEIVAVLKL